MASNSAEIREQVAKRANGKCEYCQSPERFSISGFSIEHVIPLSKDGPTTIDNLAFACQQCNNHKYNAIKAMDLVTEKMFPIFNPRQEDWSKHFAWDYQHIRIVGLTGTGRATVERLNLNRSNLKNLRALLAENGLHP